MAKKVSENNIHSITEDWGRDTSNDLPYSGAAVLKFIKDTFDTKVGCFYYDVSSNRYLVFANESKKNEYVNNPTLTELVIGTFDAPFNYEASITLLTPQYNAIFLSSTGNYVDFTFDVKNKSGNSTGENVNVTYTFIRNATKRVINETRRYGETVHMNIDEYLLEGTNTIIIGIQGQTSLAATTASITYQVINLSFQDEMNISKVYDLSKGNQNVEVFFNVSGYGTKIVEWFLDGEQLPFVKSEDEVIDVTSSRTKYIELSNLANGIHTLQSRAYTIINGEKFYTDTLYRELMVTSGNNNDNMLAIATTLPHSHGLVSTQNALTLYGAEQYIPYTIRFATRKSGDVLITLDNNALTTLHATAGNEVNYTLTYNKAGVLKLSFAGNGVNREVPISISNTSLNIEEITTQLTFDFNANGKSNSAVDKDVWSYGNYTGTFSGFNWNATSGWVNNALLLNSGASFSVDIQPLLKDATSTGKTLEFEFSTQNVEDDNAVVCDLTVNGVGLKITASEARITSAAGEYVNTKFKAGEVNRIAFVINRKTSVTYKGLVFIYVNGILSGAINYGSADNFISSTTLSFHGTDDAQVSLRSMRFYDTALSADNILNNYILYRDTLIEMMEVYYRNDIYEIGTSNFSVDLLAHYLPVMIIVGDIPTLEAATSTSTLILVDVQFIHEQDPTKSFTMKRVALRIQGTSSLAYPRKNFRFYTRVEESSLVYDYEGNLIPDKLYQFIDNAQPVDCWCLKADFAESSGTHNTGIARIWNKVMYGAVIQHTNILGEETNGYALRTEAQKIALEQDYKNDVRTTIDGFPIVLFYKQKESDTDLIFLGKYNFNNDKSTPSVFGFENIPGFDNARMQCWETKDNGHPLGLFTDVSNFDRDWSEAFESRYPDTKTPNTADLKAFSQWMSTVSQEDFATQKWAHMDVYKVAAYYVYLMRFGAVDQPVKNGFLTSEDGQKFYYINYDNDTINGLINTGELRLDPTITRQTIGTDGEYVYAGHSSVLWNRCEADTEFMDIVSIVDNALYSAGLRYDEVMSVFNDEQCDKWAERVYNQDAEYKYLLPYVNQATNNLFMLQGSRSSHRAWWLSKRFALYDSLFVSGAYRDRNISFKCLNDTQPGQKFTITAGTDMNYGYGVNNGIRETGVELNSGDAHTFTTTDTLNLGDVVKIFGASDLTQLDLSQLASRLAVLDCSAASDTVLGSKMKKLLIGGNGNVNTELSSISGINKLTSLQELNIEDYQAITSLDLTALKDMRKVYAHGSGVASINFAPGTPVEYLELPSAMMALDLQQLPYITADNIVLENGLENINSLNVIGCPKLSNDFNFVKDWVNNKTASDSQSTLIMDNVDWMNINTEEFIEFSQHKVNGLSLDLRGKVYLSSLTLDQATRLQAIWGDDCFDKNVDFRITAPDALYINPEKTDVNEGDSLQFSCLLFSSSEGSIRYRIVSGSRAGTTIDEITGLLTTVENGLADATIYVRAIYTSIEGNITYSTATVTIRKRVYPTSASITISGTSPIGQDEVYEWTTSTEFINGEMVAQWSISGDAANGYVEIKESSLYSCTIGHIKSAEMGVTVNGTLTLTLCKAADGTVVATKTKSFTMVNLSYPTARNTTLSGETVPSTDNPVYTWESTATGNIGPMDVVWTLDESILPYFEIKSEEWDPTDPLHGSCTLVKIMDVEFYMKGNINVTITRINTGESFTVSHQLMILSPDVIMTEDTNKPVLDVLYGAGLCANSTYMTKAEAEAVQDGLFNPSGASGGSIFCNNKSIISFDEFRYFTGMTTLDAYTFLGCNKLASIKLPNTVVHYGSDCFDAYYKENLIIDHMIIESFDGNTLSNYADNSNVTETSKNAVTVNRMDWYCTQSAGSYMSPAFKGARIKNLYIHAMEDNISTNPHFTKTFIENLYIDEGFTKIPNMYFQSCWLYNVFLPSTVTSFGLYAISPVNSTNCRIKSMCDSIETLLHYALNRITFETDVKINNLSNSSGSYCILAATYEQKLNLIDVVVPNDKLYFISVTYGFKYCEEFILPNKELTYYGNNSYGTISKLIIPNLNTYCKSQFKDNSYGPETPISWANSLYITDINTGLYIQITDLDTSLQIISDIPAYAFYKCKSIINYDATNIKDHNEYVFSGSTIRTLKLNNFDGQGTIQRNAFKDCTMLETITDVSYSPWTSIKFNAFEGVNENVKINSNVFGLYKHLCGIRFITDSQEGSINFESNKVAAFQFGEKTFYTKNGAFFENMVDSKTLTLGKTGVIEDLTEKLKIHYLTVSMLSNKTDAQFKLNYTSANGELKEEIVSCGVNVINATNDTELTITPLQIVGFEEPTATTITLTSGITEYSYDYQEKIEVYLVDKNANLYTQSQWESSSNPVEDLEGVCVMQTESGGFIVALNDISSYYGINKIPDELIPSYSDDSQFFNIITGKENTEILYKFNENIPVVNACKNYPFPSGNDGYIPSLGEVLLMCKKFNAVKSLLSKYGTSFSSTYLKTSTFDVNGNAYDLRLNQDSTSTQAASGSTSSTMTSKFRPFAPIGRLVIKANYYTHFTVTYTNNYDAIATTRCHTGGNYLNIKKGCEITITPDLVIGNVITEPISFVWDGFENEVAFDLLYNPGIYIQHVNGCIYTLEQWGDINDNSLANGLVVLDTHAIPVLMAKHALSTSDSRMYFEGGPYDMGKYYLDNKRCKKDFSGYENTLKMQSLLSLSNKSSQGLSMCLNYVFPNTSVQPYLPACGELFQFCKYPYNTLNEYLYAIGGDTVGANSYQYRYQYSSTLYDANTIWYTSLYHGTSPDKMRINSGGVIDNIRTEIRPFGVIKNNLHSLECVDLQITANDVNWSDTTTDLKIVCIVNGIDNVTGETVQCNLMFDKISEPFDRNMSETEEIERTVSYTCMGVTATTTFIQRTWKLASYELNLNNQWLLNTTSVPNPDPTLYDGVYESFSNVGKNESSAECYIDINGYSTFRLYIRSYAESTYDYVMVSQLDQTISKGTSTSLVKAHTSGKQNSGTSLSSYTLVEFTNIDGGVHRITILYRKDSSQNDGDDKGYLLIPKNQ